MRYSPSCTSLGFLSSRSPVAGVPPEDVVGGNAALAISRTSQRHLRRLAGHEVLDLDGIRDRIDVGVTRLEANVDPSVRA
jgi:hypothetical protein